MSSDDAPFDQLIRAIASGDLEAVRVPPAASPELAIARAGIGATRANAPDYYLEAISHYVYRGDTALHIAAASHRPAIVRALLAADADADARNRRGARPLHYAADGHPGDPRWRPSDQAELTSLLIEAGADPNATDASGVAPLHRAVRTRSAAAVDALLDGRADPHLPNRRGSTPQMLASRPTGRGGSGSPEAKAQQQLILHRLEAASTAPAA